MLVADGAFPPGLMILDDVDCQLTNSLLFTECFLCRSPGWFPAFKCNFHLLVKIALHFLCMFVCFTSLRYDSFDIMLAHGGI